MVLEIGPHRLATRRYFLVQPQEPGMPLVKGFQMGFLRLWATLPVTSDYKLYFFPFFVFGLERPTKKEAR